MEIKIEKLSFKYPSKEKKILDNINLTIKDASITGIIGKSGSGKTTLVDIISGLIKQDDGIITYNGETEILKQDIGYVFQDPKKQFFCNNVKDEISLGAKINNYRLNLLEKRVIDVLKIVNLKENILDKNPLTLSDSEAKRVMLASILIYNPKLIILDEPTMNFDLKGKLEFIKLIRTLKNRYKKTIIIISHDIDLLHKIIDDTIVINDGKIVLQGDKYEVFKDTKRLKKYGLLPPNVIAFSDKVLNKKGIKIGYRDEINDLIKDIFRNV